MKKMRFIACILMVVMLLPIISSCGKKFEYPVNYVETEYAGTTLNVFNWGEYIADGSEDYQDIVALFEKKYNIRVNYTTYASNEEMYPMLKSGSYDLIIPSDYMIGKLIEEDLLQKIDVTKLANYGNIDDKYKNLYYDPNNEYSVPYAVGMVGIIYNSKTVAAADVAAQSWDLMWNAAYRNDILTFDNYRDAFGLAMIRAGLDVNSLNEADWETAKAALLQQSPLLQGYVMDEVFDKMEGGNAKVAAYYAGDCISMMAENEDLAFYYPTEGTNIYVDAMCVPKDARNVGAAMLFMDFLMEPDIAALNSNFICYASPNTAVLTNEYYDYKAGTAEYDILYNTPASYAADPTKTQYYHTLPSDLINKYNNAFIEIKNSRG